MNYKSIFLIFVLIAGLFCGIVSAAEWTEVTSSTDWQPRFGHTTNVLDNGDIILIGGRDSGFTVYNDTYISTDGGEIWNERIATGDKFSPRYGHTTVVTPNGHIVVMGGTDGLDANTVYNDTWMSDDNGETWTEQSTNAGWRDRAFHTSVALSNGNIVLMAGAVGLAGGEPYVNDVWVTENEGVTWSEQATHMVFNDEWGYWESGGAEFSPRGYPSSVVLSDDRILILGGQNNGDTWNRYDAWISEDYGETWTKVSGDGYTDGILTGGEAQVLSNGDIVMMGGSQTYVYTSETLCEDCSPSTYIISYDDGATWSDPVETEWSPRTLLSSVVLSDDTIVIIGGLGEVDGLNDVWKFPPAAAPAGYDSTFILEILALILLFLLASIFSEENVRFGYVLIPFVAAFFWWAGFLPFAYMTTIIPLMIFMGLFSFMRMQAKYKWGVGGTSGGILYKIVFFLIMIQMVIGYVNGMGMFATNSVVTPDNEYTQYTLTSAQSVYGANSFGIDVVDMVTNGIQIMWMSFKVLWTMLASVFFIYPTLVNQFHIPVELSVILQTGIYVIYGLELFNMIFKPFKAAEV